MEFVLRPLPVYPAGESVRQITTPPPPTPRAGGGGAAPGYLRNFPSGGTSPPGGYSVTGFTECLQYG